MGDKWMELAAAYRSEVEKAARCDASLDEFGEIVDEYKQKGLTQREQYDAVDEIFEEWGCLTQANGENPHVTELCDRLFFPMQLTFGSRGRTWPDSLEGARDGIFLYRVSGVESSRHWIALLPGIPAKLLSRPYMKVHLEFIQPNSPIELRGASGSRRATTIAHLHQAAALDIASEGASGFPIQICIPRDVPTEEVPQGTEVWLLPARQDRELL